MGLARRSDLLIRKDYSTCHRSWYEPPRPSPPPSPPSNRPFLDAIQRPKLEREQASLSSGPPDGRHLGLDRLKLKRDQYDCNDEVRSTCYPKDMNEANSNSAVSYDDLHRYNFALAAIRQLGDYAVETLGSGKVHVQIKPDGTPVTNIDRDIEEKFIQLVEKEYGDEDVVLGEELSNPEDGVPEDVRIWKLDPLDGTGWVQRLLESGSADYGELRALILAAHFRHHEKIPVFGICHSPFFSNRPTTLSAINNGTFYQTVNQTPTRLFRAAFDAPTDIRLVRRYEKNGLTAATQDVSEEELRKLMPAARRVKSPLFMGNIPLNKVEVSIFPGPSQPHDVAAGALAVVNAGGVVKDFDGNNYNDIDWRRYPINGVIAGANEKLINQIIAHYKYQ